MFSVVFSSANQQLIIFNHIGIAFFSFLVREAQHKQVVAHAEGWVQRCEIREERNQLAIWRETWESWGLSAGPRAPVLTSIRRADLPIGTGGEDTLQDGQMWMQEVSNEATCNTDACLLYVLFITNATACDTSPSVSVQVWEVILETSGFCEFQGLIRHLILVQCQSCNIQCLWIQSCFSYRDYF